MNLWHMAWRYLFQRPVISILTIIGIALGVALISGVLTLKRETGKAFQNEAAIFDLVVGAKGSPLQLTLSTVYHLDAPTGNIDYALYEKLKNDNRVAKIVPLNLGDNYKGFRIVGTTEEIFGITHHLSKTDSQTPLLTIKEGQIFSEPFQAVLGSQVAAQTNLNIGDTFYSSHGLVSAPGVEEHKHHPYTVVGILNPSATAKDRAIFTTLDSVWLAHGEHHDDESSHDHDHDEHDHAGHDHEGHDHDHPGQEHTSHDHDHEDHNHAHEAEETEQESEGGFLFGSSQTDQQSSKQITAALLQLKMPGMRLFLAEEIKNQTNAMAAIPLNQMLRLYQQILDPIQKSFLAVAFLVVIVASMTVVISLYQSTERRRRDLALLRTLGAHKHEIFSLVLIEAIIIVLAGLLFGFLIGHSAVQFGSFYLMQSIGFAINAWSIDLLEIYALLTVFIIGTISGLIPALLIYRRSPLQDIAKN